MSKVQAIVLGHEKTGKTHLVQKFFRGLTPREYAPTTEARFHKFLKVDGKMVDIHVTDIGGIKDAHEVDQNIIYENDVFILCFSVNDENSIEGLIAITKQIDDIRDSVHTLRLQSHEDNKGKKDKRSTNIPNAHIILCGTMADGGVTNVVKINDLAQRVESNVEQKPVERKVTPDQCATLAAEASIKYFETSSLNETGLNELFTEVGHEGLEYQRELNSGGSSGGCCNIF